jgi:hypothetical protein
MAAPSLTSPTGGAGVAGGGGGPPAKSGAGGGAVSVPAMEPGDWGPGVWFELVAGGPSQPARINARPADRPSAADLQFAFDIAAIPFSTVRLFGAHAAIRSSDHDANPGA